MMRRLAWVAGFLIAVLARGALAQPVAVSAPSESVIGAEISIVIDGEIDPRDFVTIVAAGAEEGIYEAYRYTRQEKVTLTAPAEPGQYELRLLQAERPFATLWRQQLSVIDAVATVDAPDRVDGGAAFDVAWTGPNNARDFIAIVPRGTPEGKYQRGYRYTSRGSPLEMVAPEAAGAYEIRYLMGAPPHRTLGRRQLTVAGVSASLEVPAEINAGARFSVSWVGPDNAQDFLTIVAAGTPAREYGNYAYTKNGDPASLLAPEEPGSYEVRYLTGQNYTTLASAPIELLPVSATVTGPQSVEARGVATVTWEGPDNPQDYIIILPRGAPNKTSGHFAYTNRGPELRIQAPDEPGEYEFRYLTGRKQLTLASQPLTVTPAPIPGRLQVVSGGRQAAAAQGAAVVVVLDASGSMLQRIDGRRRIEIAREAVRQLLTTELAPDVQFSLRVFGHREKDSCRTDLEIPLGPLDRSSAMATVASVNAMNLAKTPIAATLAEVGADLSGVTGPKLVILLTDGEETCGGDPAKVIQSLAEQGADLRVNIVGFAIDELMLKETFQAWARLGNGQYFDARSPGDLAAGLSQALDLPYRVVDKHGTVVAEGTVDGPVIELAAGDYSVRSAVSGPGQALMLKAGELTVVTLGGN